MNDPDEEQEPEPETIAAPDSWIPYGHVESSMPEGGFWPWSH